MRHQVAALAILTFFLAGCGQQRTADKVAYVAANDPRMNAAIEKARSSVNQFITALKAPKPGQSSFSIKAPFTDGRNTEHFWITTVTYDGTNFQGVVANEPEDVKTVKMGQSITVAPDKISDWKYIENRKLVGGQTLRVLREMMSPAERADFDKSVPFVIE